MTIGTFLVLMILAAFATAILKLLSPQKWARRMGGPKRVRVLPKQRPCSLPRDSRELPEILEDGLEMPSSMSIGSNGLLEMLAASEQVWIVGGQGSGKTTLLAHLSDAFRRRGDLWIIDSHSEPGKWGKDAKVIGGGRNYEEIHQFMHLIINLIDTRMKKLHAGKMRQSQFKETRVFADEYTQIPRIMKKLAKDKKIDDPMVEFRDMLFQEGRKVKVFFCFATHSKRAESVGFKGAYDLFEAINHKVFLERRDGTYLAKVQYGANKNFEEFSTPGAHKRIEELKDGTSEPVKNDPGHNSRHRKMEYQEYLKTSYWRDTVRPAALKAAKGKCQTCNETKNLHVHHKTYQNRGNEHPNHMDDLIVLCAGCHSKIHDK